MSAADGRAGNGPAASVGFAPSGGEADLTKRRKGGLMDDPRRLRIVGGEDDAETAELHPEVAEFVRWFTAWWLTRGLEFVTQEEAKEQNAA